MKHIVLPTILSACMLASCHSVKNSQSTVNLNQLAKDVRGNEMLLGKCTKSALKKDPYGTWYEKNYSDYIIKKDSVELLKPLLENAQVTIFMGTWCGDSRREVPAFLKILEEAGFPEKNIDLVMVSNHDDAYKLSPGGEQNGKYIFRVPTFIFSKNGEEIGRIVESPVKTLENDMIKILGGSSYLPKYMAGKDIMMALEKESLESLRSHETEIINEVKQALVHRSELNSIGYVLLAEKKNDQALYILHLNEKIYPQEVGVYNSLADAYWRIGDKAKAKEYLQKAIAIKPDHEFTVELGKKIL